MWFTVEITLDGTLGQQMSDMRIWLDHRHYVAVNFRRKSPVVWDVDFQREVEAREFAQAFAGRLLNAS